MHRSGFVAMNEEQMREGHQALAAQRQIKSVLVADGQHFVAVAVLKIREDNVGGLRAGAIEDAEFEELGARGDWPQLRAERNGDLVFVGPELEPFIENGGRDFSLDEMLVLRRALAHGFGGGGATG